MYAVILAGGGGTRLRPLQPARAPEAIPAAARRRHAAPGDASPAWPGLTDDVTVVADRRHVPLVRAAGARTPAVIGEPLGRNTAAAIALAALAIAPRGRGHGRPPGRPDGSKTMPVFRRVLAAAEHARDGRFGIEDPLVTLGIAGRPAGNRIWLPRPGRRSRRRRRRLRAYPLKRFDEKPKPDRAASCWQHAGRRLERRHLRVAAAARSLAALERYTGLVQSLGRGRQRTRPRARLRADPAPVSIDYAVMEGAAQDGQVVMAAMDVGWSDLGSWSALLGAIGARGTGAVVQAGDDGRGRDGRPRRAAGRRAARGHRAGGAR